MNQTIEAEMAGFDDIVQFILNHNPERWMLTFDVEATLEYFPEDYHGSLESGCGVWSATGTPDVLLQAAGKFLERP